MTPAMEHTITQLTAWHHIAMALTSLPLEAWLPCALAVPLALAGLRVTVR